MKNTSKDLESFSFFVRDRAIPWNPLESLLLRASEAPSIEVYIRKLANRSISCCSQNADSDLVASKTQNLPSACLQCWNSLGWEVARRAWDQSCDLGQTPQQLKVLWCQDCFVPKPFIVRELKFNWGPKPLYYWFHDSFVRVNVISLAWKWNAAIGTGGQSLNKSLLIIYSALCILFICHYHTFWRTASYNDTMTNIYKYEYRYKHK